MSDVNEFVRSSPSANSTLRGRERILGLIQAMRPRHWIKNLACFAGVIFSGKVFESQAIVSAFLSFLGFCLAASAIYLINDLFDRKSDRENPRTRHRPIAAGSLPTAWALIAAVCLVVLGSASSIAIVSIHAYRRLAWLCPIILATYVIMNIAYSARLKHTVLVDVLIVALGFVFRVVHGVYAVGVMPTRYIALCMFFLALFLGFSKRRGELVRQVSETNGRRPVLGKYTVELLDGLIIMSATMTVIFYTQYTVAGHFAGTNMVVTVPLVFYGVTRYMLTVLSRGGGEAPESELLADRFIWGTVFVWIIVCVLVIYGKIPPIFEA